MTLGVIREPEIWVVDSWYLVKAASAKRAKRRAAKASPRQWLPATCSVRRAQPHQLESLTLEQLSELLGGGVVYLLGFAGQRARNHP